MIKKVTRHQLETILKMTNGEAVIEYFNSEKTALAERNKLYEIINFLYNSLFIRAFFHPEDYDVWNNIYAGFDKNDGDIIRKLYQYNDESDCLERTIANFKNYGKTIKANNLQAYDENQKQQYIEQFGIFCPLSSFKFAIKQSNENQWHDSALYIAVAKTEFKSAKRKYVDNFYDEFARLNKQYSQAFGTLFTNDLNSFGYSYEKMTKYDFQVLSGKLHYGLNNPEYLSEKIKHCSLKQEQFIAKLCNQYVNSSPEDKTSKYLELIQNKLNNYQAKEIIETLKPSEISEFQVSEEIKQEVINHYSLDKIK